MSTYRDDERAGRELAEMRSTKRRLLGPVRIASACTESWAEMYGDDCVRHCGLCKKKVYDVSAMTLSEAEDFVEEHRGGFHQRSDGKILTADCPSGSKRKARRLHMIGAAVATALAALLGVDALVRSANNDPTDGAAMHVAPPAHPMGTSQAIYK